MENDAAIQKEHPQSLRNRQNSAFGDSVAIMAKKNIIDNVAMMAKRNIIDNIA